MRYKNPFQNLENFKINWRPNAKRVIITFSDEHGQSFMIPKSILGGSWNSNYDGVTQDILLSMIGTSLIQSYIRLVIQLVKILQCRLVTLVGSHLALVNGGKWYELSHSSTQMYSNLMEIIDKEVCGNE
jgi:hypothetical protein